MHVFASCRRLVVIVLSFFIPSLLCCSAAAGHARARALYVCVCARVCGWFSGRVVPELLPSLLLLLLRWWYVCDGIYM
ncbi:hypothetical protein RR46_02555 [Papilio xuthus]|uniref:Secreted protein n=1 Tax=Papilio xuthus TaxID=66420 RepID=A0A194Q274_PAPXU|nr:hypothetical protein RR46_02555 [Papilio xuthus]